jgi:hypothetical protein
MNPQAPKTPQREAEIQSRFACHICEGESTEICVYCTKDACELHLCDRCRRCTDCCVCHIGNGRY